MTKIIFKGDCPAPLVENGEKQRFFPIETVAAIGEVKSILSKVDFKKAINKLCKVKKIRGNLENPSVLRKENSKKFSSSENNEDQITSFLICQKLDFDLINIENEIISLYENENIDFMHNIIISVEDGILLYENEKVAVPYYRMDNSINKPIFIKKDLDDIHFKVFASNLFLTTSTTTILFPDIASYIQ